MLIDSWLCVTRTAMIRESLYNVCEPPKGTWKNFLCFCSISFHRECEHRTELGFWKSKDQGARVSNHTHAPIASKIRNF